MTEVQEKFIKILKEMFQFDQADLDFGIYRIMNAKHDEIEKFLNVELPNEISDGLSTLASYATTEQIKKIDEQIEIIKEGSLSETIKKQTLAGLEEQKDKLKKTTNIEAAQNEIYNDLLNFFSCYYDEGDFISQRRYSKDKYAIPYEGEEVKLYWANADQYYIKTSEYFKDYTFTDEYGHKAHFKILDAQVEQNNNKSKNKKFFQLTADEKKFEIKEDELFIYFEYKTGTKNKQRLYNIEIFEAFKEYAEEHVADFSSFLPMTVRQKGQEYSLLEKQINRYTAKNSFDYFIHKDLGGFLNRELDYFIKNEIIRLDDIDENDESNTKHILTKVKVFKTIAKKIIAFLAQLEDFQKKLFLKKKFVTETNYCITLDRIDESFYEEIASNEEQRKEWVKLFAIDEIKHSEGDIFDNKTCYSEPLSVQFLKENPYLLLDTAFFNDEFKEKIVGCIDVLDDNLDGLLVNSENLSLLNLIGNLYNNQIKTIYIDPPYNTEGDGFLYKDNYRESSWLSMIFDRLYSARKILEQEGVIFISIDENEQNSLRFVCDYIFGKENFVSEFVWKCRNSLQHDEPLVSRQTERIICYVKNRSLWFDEGGVCFNRIRKPFDATEYKNPDNDPRGPWLSSGKTRNDGRPSYTVVSPTGKEFTKPWIPSPDEFKRWEQEKLIWWGKDGNSIPRKKSFLKDFIGNAISDIVFDEYTDEIKGENQIKRTKQWEAGTTESGTKGLKDLFGADVPFSYPKPVKLIKFFSQISLAKNNIILDFFAGSGTTAHAVIETNREDKGNRKYILCEMGEYFDTVTKPRIEKVIYSIDWKDGKPVSRNGSSHAFKYIRLESYEDTLNNIVFKSSGNDLLESVRQDYVINYMLDFESRDSDCLLNIEKLAHPFDYTMKITRKQECKEQKIDLVETFNYLIGLNVISNGAIQTYDATFTEGSSKPVVATLKNQGSKYRIKMIEGTNRAGERVLVIWRDLTGDIEKDNAVLDAFFAKKHVNPLDFEYKTIYVNGDNNLQNVKTEDETWKVILIESEMKKRMFSEN